MASLSIAGLVASGLPMGSARAEDPPVDPAPQVSAPVSPDVLDFPSAVVQARATGERVEVTAERSEASTTWANPDGTLTTTQYAAPVRFQDDEGAWREYDTTLVEQEDGSISPKAVPDGVVLAGEVEGTEKKPVEVASADAGKNGSVALTWGDSLPDPVVKGSAATYEGAWPGIDLVVHATRDGFEQSFVIADREALLDYSGESVAASDGGGDQPAPSDGGGDAPAAGSGPVTWDVPLQVDDSLTVREVKGERVEFVDQDDKVVSSFEVPLAWDASVDKASREHLARTAVSVEVLERKNGLVTLRLGVDRAWLLDDARVFPVTVDPVYAKATAKPTFDAFVQTNYSSDRSSEQELKVGTYDGTNKARSFLTFANSSFKGLQIQSATLNLYETWSYSCTASALEVWSVGSAVDSSVRWTNQPAMAAKQGSVNVAKGANSSCAAGWVNIPITNLAKSWSTSSAASVSLGLKAGTETNTVGWKRFGSMESTTPPSITFTYDRKPNQATVPVVENTGTYEDTSYAWKKRPALSTTATDPDGNAVSAEIQVHTSTAGNASTLLGRCTTAKGTSGQTLSCAPGFDFPDNTTLYLRAKATDEIGVAGLWSGWKTVKTAQTAPSAPGITCNVANGSWSQTKPSASLSCSVVITQGLSNNSPINVRYMVDGATTETVMRIAPGPRTVALPAIAFTEGAHKLTVRVSTASTMASAPVSFQTGWGGPSVIRPAPLAASNGSFAVEASAPPVTSSGQSVTAQQQWRLAGTTAAWTNAGSAATLSGTVGKPLPYKGTFDASTALASAGNTSRGPVRMEFRICFTYPSITPLCTDQTRPTTLVRVPHAFGGGYPTTDVEAGQVALYTGEFQTTATDVSVPGYGSNISLDRSHLSYTGTGDVKDWPVDGVTGVFGPGFTANLEGDDATGLAGMDVVDQRMSDGTIALVDDEGEPLVFVNPTGKVGTVTGALLPGTEDTELSGVTAQIAGTAAAPKLLVTEDDGTITTFTPVTGGASKNLLWHPASIAEPGQAGATTFGHDATTGAVTRIVAPLPDGLTGMACPTSGTLSPGCRAIDLTYTTVTDPNGKQAQRLSSVAAVMYNPATKQVESKPVTTYTYDALTRLSKVTDVRSNLSTTYTWDGSTTRIKTITPSGLAGYTVNYAANPDTSIPTQVVKNVQRGAQTSGGAAVQIASIVYDVPVSGTGLPNLSETGISAWVKDEKDSAEYAGQKPVNGYAVFSSDHPVTALVGTSLSAADLQYADLQYINAEAYTINSASYGAGAWQITAARYDEQGNVVRELDAGAVATAIATPDLDGPGVDALSTQTFYNTDQKNSAGDVVLSAGSVVTDEFGPARDVLLADGSTTARLRPHTATVYDQGAPNSGVNPATGQAYALPTTVTMDAVTTDSTPGNITALEEVSTTTNAYTPIDGKGVDDPTSGWVLGIPTTVKDSLGRTTKQRFDARGKQVESRMPASNGTDAGTTKTIYYTAAANSEDASCGASDQAKAWAGEICRTFPAAAPSSGPTLPSTKVTGYDFWLAPTTTVETSGSASRTSQVTYDAAGRAIWTKTSTSGVTGSIAQDAIFTQYNQTTGLVDAVGVSNAMNTGIGTVKESYTYDLWGKETSYTNQLGDKTTTAYDTAARVVKVTDPKGTTTFTYDGNDANGKAERRSLVTTQTITRTGSDVLTYAAAYDADGAMTTEKLPGAITATHLVDEAGEEVGLTYAGQLTDPDTGEVSTGAWLAWSQTNDILGRVRTDSATFASQIAAAAGVEADAESAVEDPLDFDHRYTYDKGGNLTKVEDLTGLPVGGSEVSPYTVREYTFTTNGARKTLKETIRADGTTTGAASTGIDQSLTYDTADRLTGGYVYDLLGRQTTVPAAHAPNTAGGDITLKYFDSDLPAKVTQGGTVTSFTLDVAQRRLVQSSVTASKTTTTTRHYTDGSDNPAWIDTARPDGTSETLRYTSSISGDLGASIATDGGTSLMLPNIHGDTVTTIPIPDGTPATAAATTIAGWSSYTEYGTPIDPAQTAAVGTSAGYGWLGSKERSTAAGTVGLTLMGVRFYNRVTGAFTSTDNIVGANNTAYNYPTNPVGLYDLDGEKPRNKRRSNHRADRHWEKSDPAQRVRWGNKRGSAGGPSAGNKFSRKQLRKLKRSAGRCAYCQKHLKAGQGHGDHIVPKANGGNSTPRNLQRTCSSCNLSKGARSAPGGGGGRGGFAAGGFGGGKPYLKNFR